MTPALTTTASAASKAILAAQTAVAQLVSAVSDATAKHRLWDYLGLVPGGVPITIAGIGVPPNVPAWAKTVPSTTRWAVMDIVTPTMDQTVPTDVYSPGGRGSADVLALANAFALARIDLPAGTKIGTTCYIPSNGRFNADYAAGGAANTQWIYSQMRACAPAYANADFLAIQCYTLDGQSSKDFLAQAIQWIGMARETGLPVMAVVQLQFTDSGRYIPADQFGMYVEALAGVADLGIALWGSPDPKYRAGYLASPGVAWLKGRVASDGTLNLY